MRPRPVCTEQHLKDVSTALRQTQKPPQVPPRVRSGIPESSRALVGFGLLAFLFWLVLARFGGPNRVDSTPPAPAPLPAAIEVRRATLVTPEVRRATLVKLPVGCRYWAVLPDGTRVWTTYKGAVDSFSEPQDAKVRLY
jgi:hypothetical protein